MTISPLESIVPGIWASLGKLGSNNGIIESSEGSLLVDVPHKPSDAIALAELISEKPRVAWIVHTDHHIDHTLTNGFFPGAVVSHVLTYERLKEDMPTVAFVQELLGTLDPDGQSAMALFPERVPTVVFEERLGIRLGGVVVDLVALPGHTPNTIGVHLPEVGLLFSGDAVSGMGLPSFQESSFRAWRSSIDKVLSLEFDVLVPGHGQVGSRETVIEFRDQIDEFVGQVTGARDSGMTSDEAAEVIRFEDRIHVTTADYQGYPPSMIEQFQRRSVQAIFSELADEAAGIAPFYRSEPGSNSEQMPRTAAGVPSAPAPDRSRSADGERAISPAGPVSGKEQRL